MDYYKIPIRFDELTKKHDLPRCGLKESVSGMVRLLATSSFGECKHDESFGCDIWNHDFENITNAQFFKENVRESLNEAISRFEKRIEFVSVEVDIEQVISRIKRKRIKNRILLTVKGKLAMTNEDFMFSEHFYIGPLSYY
jgi:phage baseplate assembly protein W